MHGYAWRLGGLEAWRLGGNGYASMLCLYAMHGLEAWRLWLCLYAMHKWCIKALFAYVSALAICTGWRLGYACLFCKWCIGYALHIKMAIK